MNRRFVDRPSSIIDLPRLTALISRVARARKKDELPHFFARSIQQKKHSTDLRDLSILKYLELQYVSHRITHLLYRLR